MSGTRRVRVVGRVKQHPEAGPVAPVYFRPGDQVVSRLNWFVDRGGAECVGFTVERRT